MEDNEPWNQDRFGNHVPSGRRYDKLRSTQNFNPVQGETLLGYVDRMHNWIKNQEDINTKSHIYGRKMWYTHKNPTSCFMCQDIEIHWKLFEVFQNIAKLLPKTVTFDGQLFTNPEASD